MRFFITGDPSEVLKRLQKEPTAAPSRGTIIHPAAERFVPLEYAPGALGWSVPYSLIEEPGGLRRRAVLVEDTVDVRTFPEVAAAVRVLPSNWHRAEAAGTDKDR